jgi:hypothetical protein
MLAFLSALCFGVALGWLFYLYRTPTALAVMAGLPVASTVFHYAVLLP